MSAVTDDLRFAQQTGKAVQVRLYSQTKLGEHVGVHDVNEEEGWVSFRTPETFGDDTTRARVELSDIASVMVSDMDFWSRVASLGGGDPVRRTGAVWDRSVGLPGDPERCQP